nr:hypothetical protein [uncultured Kingella sp.]
MGTGWAADLLERGLSVFRLPFAVCWQGDAKTCLVFSESVLQVGWALAAHALHIRRQPETRAHPTQTKVLRRPEAA